MPWPAASAPLVRSSSSRWRMTGARVSMSGATGSTRAPPSTSQSSCSRADQPRARAAFSVFTSSIARVIGPTAARHRGPPWGDDPRPAGRQHRGAERPSRRPAAAGCRAQRARALRLLLRDRRHAELPRRGSSAPRRWRSRRCSTPTSTRWCSRRRSCTRPGDPWMTLLRRLTLLPWMPISGDGQRASSRSGPRTWPLRGRAS